MKIKKWKNFNQWLVIASFTIPILSACSGSAISSNNSEINNNTLNSQNPDHNSDNNQDVNVISQTPDNDNLSIKTLHELSTLDDQSEPKYFEMVEDDAEAYEEDLNDVEDKKLSFKDKGKNLVIGAIDRIRRKTHNATFITPELQIAKNGEKIFFDAAAKGSIQKRANDLVANQDDHRLETATYAGTHITKVSVTNAIRSNLKIDKKGKPKDLNLFIKQINQFLALENKINATDAKKIRKITIVPKTQKKKFSLKNLKKEELSPQSYENPFVQDEIRIRIFAKDGEKFSFNNSTILNITGKVNIRLTDYLKIDETKLENEELILVPSKTSYSEFINHGKDAIKELNNVFSLESLPGELKEINKTPFSSILGNWNMIKDKAGQYVPKWAKDFDEAHPQFKPFAIWLLKKSIRFGLKAYLSPIQFKILEFVFKKAKDVLTNYLSQPGIKDGIENVSFKLSSSKPKPLDIEALKTKLQDIKYKNNIVQQKAWYYVAMNVDMTVDLIHYWSWNRKSYGDNQKSKTFQNLNVYLMFENPNISNSGNANINDLFQTLL